MAAKWAKRITLVWIWVSLWMTTVAFMSEIMLPPVSGLVYELMIFTGVTFVGAIVATKLTAFITTLLTVALTAIELAKKETINRK